MIVNLLKLGIIRFTRRTVVLTSEEIVVYQPDPDGTGRGVHSRYVYEVFGPLCVAFTKRDRDTDHIFRLFLMVLPVTEQTEQSVHVEAEELCV